MLILNCVFNPEWQGVFHVQKDVCEQDVKTICRLVVSCSRLLLILPTYTSMRQVLKFDLLFGHHETN